MTQAKSDSKIGIEQFERAVVFRLARGYFFVMAVLAVVGILGGIGAVVLGVVRIPPTRPTPPPEVAAPPAIDLARVDQWMKEQEAQARPSAAHPSTLYDEQPSAADARDDSAARRRREESQEIARLSTELRALFPEPDYVWDDQFRDVCRRPTPFGCLERGHELVKSGVFGVVKQALADLPRTEVIPVLRVLLAVVSQAPIERRGKLVLATVQTYKAVNAAYLEQVRSRERAIAAAESEYRQKQAEQEASKAQYRLLGSYGALGGLALLVLVSLFLAHFAIERHLRLLQRIATLEGGLRAGAEGGAAG